ncbi:MAG: RNA polymerase sigma factor FliA [Pseudomonadota bacterium]
MLSQVYAVTPHYPINKDEEIKERIEQHLIIVKKIAFHLKAKLPDHVLVDDLIQSGMVGLIEAAKKFDSRQGASFETYAGIRIRGAMLDEIRKNDWTPRSVHRNSRMVSKVIHMVENKIGRHSTDVEIAAEMGVSLDEYHHMILDSATHRILSFDDFSLNDESIVEKIPNQQPQVLDGLAQQDLKKIIAQAISELPKRESLMMSLYYDEELNLREIGVILGVSESRVSQIHSQAVIRLQVKLKKMIEETKV